MIYLTVRTAGNEEAVRAYTMIDPIQQMLDDIEELMKYRNYQPAIDKITEVIEVKQISFAKLTYIVSIFRPFRTPIIILP